MKVASYRPWHILFASLFIAGPLFAVEASRLLTDVEIFGDVNGRTTTQFSSRNNIAAVVTKGSKAAVLETKKLNNGSYAVKVKVTDPGDPQKPNSAKKGDIVWVHYSQKTPWMDFYNESGKVVEDPEIALRADAKVDGFGRKLPDNGKVSARESLQNGEEIVDSRKCDTCAGQKPLSDKGLNNLRELSAAIKPVEKKQPAKVSRARRLHLETQTDRAGSIFVAKENQQANAIGSKVPELSKTKATSGYELEQRILRYSNSPNVQSMISYAEERKFPDSVKWCYRYVKRALMAGNLSETTYLPGRHAKEAVQDLPKIGFINLLDDPAYRQTITSPSKAPKGAILVYRAKDGESGHIEIKTGEGDDGGYISDYKSKESVLGNANGGLASKRYRLVGVYIK